MSEMTRTRSEINRENAAGSTGPRTPEGKARSAQNARKHGMTASPTLAHEDDEAFEEMRNNILEDVRPETGHEHDLALEVAEAFWHRRRVCHMRNAFLDVRVETISTETDGTISGDRALAQLLIDSGDMQRTRLMLRYVTAAERACKAAMEAFRQAKHERLQREAEEREAEEREAEEQAEAQRRQIPEHTKEALNQRLVDRLNANPQDPAIRFVLKNGNVTVVRILAPGPTRPQIAPQPPEIHRREAA